MSHLLYCVYGYDNQADARGQRNGHLYWFNPRMICTAKSYADEKLAKLQISNDSLWCSLGEWESIIDEIHTHFCKPKDVRIQEVIVTK